MRFGPFDITVRNHGFFRLDGGAMFGTVPKAIWSKLSPPDVENRIPHFAGARPGDEGGTALRYPEARIHVQAANYETAKAPNARERASYIAEDTKLLGRTRLPLAPGSPGDHPGHPGP